MYSALATITAGVHFLALLYIGLGGFLAWRWPWAIFPHIPFALWGFAVIAFDLICPLTWVEDRFRAAQGLGPLPGGFNEHYIYGTIVPYSLLPVVAIGAIVAVVVSYVGAYLRWKALLQERDRVPSVVD
ncbi:DUF2784 domain-containing protein [Haloechinothrix sp. LS1_15]|nr:DUF2784 domain-containing protein [Haloechinothrix sp. LS1_15]MDV6011146.1 DUF2784 domain-containing protein [Haloechinothrix sp. LS1_15]